MGASVWASAAAGGTHLGFAPADVLGAAVASTDPVAALAIARRVGMPASLITLLAGEGLLNDATSLTLFQAGVASVTGYASVLSATGRFLAAVAGGVGFGFAVAWLIIRIRRFIPDAASHGVLSLATPFLAYLPAEALHTSGVLAVVVCGLWMGHRSPAALPGRSRLQLNAVWQVIEVALQGFVFFLIGDQLSTTTRQVLAYPPLAIGLAVGATVGAVLVVRALWLWVENRRVVRILHLSLEEPGGQRLGRGELTVMWWAGSRGVITLAAAYSIPRTIGMHHPFPDRALVIFCAYILVLVTLVAQGTTLAPVVRALHLPTNGAEARKRLAEARAAAVDAGLKRLDDLLEEDPQPDDLVAPLRGRASFRRQRSEDRLSALEEEQHEESRGEVARRLRASMIDAERDELLRWRDSGRLPDRDLRVLQRELDYEEGTF